MKAIDVTVEKMGIGLSAQSIRSMDEHDVVPNTTKIIEQLGRSHIESHKMALDIKKAWHAEEAIAFDLAVLKLRHALEALAGNDKEIDRLNETISRYSESSSDHDAVRLAVFESMTRNFLV